MLTGKPPLLSIELTCECPLHCAGCYAYDDNHLGGSATLRQLADLRGDQLVDRVIQLVRQQRTFASLDRRRRAAGQAL